MPALMPVRLIVYVERRRTSKPAYTDAIAEEVAQAVRDALVGKAVRPPLDHGRATYDVHSIEPA